MAFLKPRTRSVFPSTPLTPSTIITFPLPFKAFTSAVPAANAVL